MTLHPSYDPQTETLPLCHTVILAFHQGIQLLIHHSLVETADWLMITAGLNGSWSEYYKFKWLLFSAGNHSICSPNDLFYWPCHLFMDISDAGQVLILTLRWAQAIAWCVLVLVKVIWLQSAWLVSKTLAIRHFDQLEACSCVSSFYPLIQRFFSAMKEWICL